MTTLYEGEDFIITIDELEVVTYTNKNTDVSIILDTVQDTHFYLKGELVTYSNNTYDIKSE